MSYARRLHAFLDAQFTQIFCEFLERSQVSLDDEYREDLRRAILHQMGEDSLDLLIDWKQAGAAPVKIPICLKTKMIERITLAIRTTCGEK